MHRRTTALLAALLAGPLLACRVEEQTGPDAPPARLALSAQVVAAAGRTVELRVMYQRVDASAGVLLLQRFDIGGDVGAGQLPTGTPRSVPIPVDLGPCLADSQHLVSGQGCQVTVILRLLDADTELDRVTVGPLRVEPGGTTAVTQFITLREVRSVTVVVPPPGSIVVGGTLQLSAVIVDAANQIISGRSVEWVSSNSGVAAVSATGNVTGVAVGTAIVTARVGGREGSATVTVTPRPPVAVVRGQMNPAVPSVEDRNGDGGTSLGLSLSPPMYAVGSSEWLQPRSTRRQPR